MPKNKNKKSIKVTCIDIEGRTILTEKPSISSSIAVIIDPEKLIIFEGIYMSKIKLEFFVIQNSSIRNITSDKLLSSSIVHPNKT